MESSRQQMDALKLRVMRLSMTISFSLGSTKLFVSYVAGSQGVFAEAANSYLDFISSTMTYFILRHSSAPADENHPYGHGKFENLASILQSLLISLTAGFIFLKAGWAILYGQQIVEVGLSVAVMVLSALTSLWLSLKLLAVAKTTDSVAVKGDAIHFLADVYSNAGVILALILVSVTKFQWFDPVMAIVVGLIIFYSAFELFSHSIRDLMDYQLEEESLAQIRAVLEDHGDLILRYENLRARRSGSNKIIDFKVTCCRNKSLLDVHDVMDHIESEIESVVSQSTVMIHPEPCGAECENGRRCRLENASLEEHRQIRGQ